MPLTRAAQHLSQCTKSFFSPHIAARGFTEAGSCSLVRVRVCASPLFGFLCLRRPFYTREFKGLSLRQHVSGANDVCITPIVPFVLNFPLIRTIEASPTSFFFPFPSLSPSLCIPFLFFSTLGGVYCEGTDLCKLTPPPSLWAPCRDVIGLHEQQHQ